MEGVTWRAATWNLDHRMRNPRRVSPWELIRRVRAEVVALQEVQGREIRVLRQEHPGVAIFSQELYAPANLRWMGCALLFPPGTEIIGTGVFPTLPKPQRGLWARVLVPDLGELTAISWHAPNAAGDTREVKMAAYSAMSAWLAASKRPLLLGADLNTWLDPPELVPANSADPRYEEQEFVGPNPRHGLLDGYRAVLEQTGRWDSLRSSAPPLAVSYVLSNGTRHRMDRIFASPELLPVDGGYWYYEAIQAGSDHGLHWIEFERVRGRTASV